MKPTDTVDHRAALERVAADLVDVYNRRAECEPTQFKILIVAMTKAMNHHLRALGMPESVTVDILRKADAFVTEALQVKAALEKLHARLDELEAASPALCQHVLEQLAETGRFLMAECNINAPAPTRRQ